uniref:Uncharacterized protein n=1 Tax=Mycena chlorophos TaxID=658473 RepID=A0ABQ0LWB9_MYCCL|nr:predicted protein [Mycena chlorophos]
MMTRPHWLLSRNTSYGFVLGFDAPESVEKVRQLRLERLQRQSHQLPPHLEPDAAIPNATNTPSMSKSPLPSSSSLSDITNTSFAAHHPARPSPFPIRLCRPAHQHPVSHCLRSDANKHTRAHNATDYVFIQNSSSLPSFPCSRCKTRSECEDVGWSAVVLTLVRVEVEPREGPLQRAKQV